MPSTSPADLARLPEGFGRLVARGVEGILRHQRDDGSIIYEAKAPLVYPQQALFPLAFCWAGLDPEKRHARSAEVREAIAKLGAFLVRQFNERGEFHYNSHGYEVKGVDQRLTYAWVEGLRILREAGGDFDFEAWGGKIQRACETLLEHRLKKLAGLRRFIGRVTGTSINHVSLYLTTLYRSGTVLKRPDLADFVLPIARALAADVHPDGYWEEHGDLLRSGGPTPSYNYLTHCAMALFYEWTGEAVFRAALERSTRFHGAFSYPDGTFLDLIDERVRYGPLPRVWGLFGFSHSPEGRGTAARKFKGWLARCGDLSALAPETLARHCENALYWHEGESVPAPFERYDHRASLTLPARIVRRGVWCLGLSAMRATNAGDPAYRESPFALERQKLFSVWHEQTGLILDGSHSKFQPENSTFSCPAAYAVDYLPCGGATGEEGGDHIARAAYRTFLGTVRLRILTERTLQIDLSVEPLGCQGPFTAGFTMRPRGEILSGLSGKTVCLQKEAFSAGGPEWGGGFNSGNVTLKGPDDMQVHWPFSPFNSYAKDHRSGADASLLRFSVGLTPERPRAAFVLTIAP